MRSFTYQLIAAANDWVKQTHTEHLKAQKRLASVTKKYQRDLEALESRVRRKAWQFLRYGFGDKSLHDARLLSLRVGDGLGFIANGEQPFHVNRQTTSVVIEFLNYQQNARYSSW